MCGWTSGTATDPSLLYRGWRVPKKNTWPADRGFFFIKTVSEKYTKTEVTQKQKSLGILLYHSLFINIFQLIILVFNEVHCQLLKKRYCTKTAETKRFLLNLGPYGTLLSDISLSYLLGRQTQVSFLGLVSFSGSVQTWALVSYWRAYTAVIQKALSVGHMCSS